MELQIVLKIHWTTLRISVVGEILFSESYPHLWIHILVLCPIISVAPMLHLIIFVLVDKIELLNYY